MDQVTHRGQPGPHLLSDASGPLRRECTEANQDAAALTRVSLFSLSITISTIATQSRTHFFSRLSPNMSPSSLSTHTHTPEFFQSRTSYHVYSYLLDHTACPQPLRMDKRLVHTGTGLRGVSCQEYSMDKNNIIMSLLSHLNHKFTFFFFEKRKRCPLEMGPPYHKFTYKERFKRKMEYLKQHK